MPTHTDDLESVLRGRHSYYVRQWINYQEVNRNRAKLLHDIRLLDGSEHVGYYPNGNSWNKFTPGGEGKARYSDEDVSHIRLSIKQIGDR